MNQALATLSDMQRVFVKAVAKHGNATLAAHQAGYRNPDVDGWRLRNLPHVQAAVALEVRQFLTMTAGPAALNFLYDVMTDPKGQWDNKLRVASAKTLADRSGFIAPKASAPSNAGGKSIAEMERTELIETAQRIARELSDRAVTIINNEPSAPAVDPDVLDILE